MDDLKCLPSKNKCQMPITIWLIGHQALDLLAEKRCFWCFYFTILPIFRKSSISFLITVLTTSPTEKISNKKFDFIQTKTSLSKANPP